MSLHGGTDRNKAIDSAFKAGYKEGLKDSKLLEMLKECKLQLEYLNEKFTETGTTNSLLSKIESLIKQSTDL